MANSQLSFLVLALSCILSVSADVYLSIDCGTSDSYKDTNLLDWTGDDNYIKNGESHTVQSNSSISRALDTLRVFTTRNKNCYRIDSIRKGRVLVRASFNYGNYDNRSSPPSFDLHFDGNYWATVRTSSMGNVYYEVIYSMKKDWISVCLAQTEQGQFPFISALEIRGLEANMYRYGDDTLEIYNYPLFLRTRVAFGSNSTVRYADDHYDRIWSPVSVARGSRLTQATSNATFGGGTFVAELPPPAVMKNAVTAVSRNSTINLNMGLPSFEIPVYANWYFSEVAQLQPNETRTFTLHVNNASTPPFSPPYDNCSEWYISNFSLSSNDTITLVPTANSTLPPLINAMEIFSLGDALTNGTNTNDVEGLASLQRAFDVLQDWNGDPCLPANYTWDWIQCNTDNTPRVTALFLGSFGLSGILPNFSSMNALQKIDLHNNSLNGSIPVFLGTLPSLNELNLANNNFGGSVPASLSQRNGLNLTLSGNHNLCTSGNSCVSSESTQNTTNNSSGSEKIINHLSIIPAFIFIIWFVVGVQYS
ncbi:hypothetical protein ACJIZ3_012607 [Penstemon smallii]|uniref:Malectin-like domain-containing protein n=1 Tax=Penstemon smallii TaxID=265156 RepID=A0ABD3UNT5_9LAMI